ncbi:MAG: hypothetical protein KAG12_03660, partial [Desulfuromusa sp.]|nr:hypothetical protein [Desulfuromusa sp.]
MKLRHWILIVTLLIGIPGYATAELEPIFGTIQDAQTGDLLSGAELRTVDDYTSSAMDGSFQLRSSAAEIVVRLPGYLPQKVATDFPLHLKLQPFTPKALYLSYWAADSNDRRNQLQQLIADTGMNALVIDLKSTRG